MLRGLVAMLLAANLAFFCWTQGWLDHVVGVRAGGDREPERMTRQVRPAAVRVLPFSAAAMEAPAATLAMTCLEAGPYTEAQASAAQAAAQAALPAGSWADVPTETPGSWIVYMGRYTSQDSLTKKEDELKRRKLPYEEFHGSATLEPGLVLGRFDARAAAAQALAQFTQQGVRTARVVELAPPVVTHMLRIPKADAALAAKAIAVKADALGRGFAPCVKPAGA